ncbi:heme NO binding domain-containing protein [Calothrix sp. NIES-4071]|nr:heme NO binding domain-containing protein [Calothrix sp. NIES-4071]BAZ60175.1 heme NO binding domain-containing protein [Calothrix sp. NIES-4105]
MYGLVNKAIQELVCSRFGEETWGQIKQKAEIQTDTFLSMEAYPDDLTHRLVVAASQVLGISTAEVMQAFGEFWVSYTGKEGYGEMMDMGGDNLPEFLGNLDELHARVGINFPKLVPPSFECHEVKQNQLELHYHSSRSGLAPMVTGLVKGLGQKFDTEVKVTQTQSREQGSEHDAFLIEYKPN